MPRLEFTFKSGATVGVDVTTWKYEAKLGATKLTWEIPDKARRDRLVHVDLDEVVAIVEVK